MGTEIKTWEIKNGKLSPVSTDLKTEGRTEPYDLEPWLASNPEVIGADIMIIGRQVKTKSGELDLLGIDKSGNTVIIELKRDKLPRESLAQAIDYASDIADWTVERLGEVCFEYKKKSLEDALNDDLPNIDLEDVSFNINQRIVLVGFSIEASLERMIQWLSDSYGVNINAVILNYIKTKSGDELLAKTSVISEEMEQKQSRGKKKFEHSERQNEYFAFYSDLVSRLKMQIPREYVTPSFRSIFQILTGVGGVHFEWAFHRSGFGVELHFEKGNKDSNLKMIERMEQLKNAIEKELDEKVTFQRNWGKTWSRLYVEKQETEINEELKVWAVDKMVKLINLLQPELDNMKSG